MLDFETASLLEAWGRWSKSDVGLNIGFKSRANFASQIGTTVRGEMISDDVGCEVDAAVSTLKRIDHELWEAVTEYYQNGCNESYAARVMKTTTSRINKLVAEGRGIITGLLYGKRK